MAVKEETDQELRIHHAITFDWKLKNWGKILDNKKKCIEINFAPDLKIFFNLWIDTNNVHVSINRWSYKSSISAICCHFCLVDSHGCEMFRESKFVTFQLYMNSVHFTTLNIGTVKRVLHLHDDSLTIRCTLTAGKVNVLENITQTRASPRTDMVKDDPHGGNLEIRTTLSVGKIKESSTQTEEYEFIGKQRTEQATQTITCNSTGHRSSNQDTQTDESNKTGYQSSNQATQTDEASKMGTTLLLETLSADLNNIYVGKMVADCLLKTRTIHFSVHRAVLSARSKVFMAMFTLNKSEIFPVEVDIEDVDATTLTDVLHYVYTGKVRGLTENTAAAMLTVSDKYALLELRKTCLQFLLHNLTIENICDAAFLSQTHKEAALEEQVLRFIDEKSEEVLKSDIWKDFFQIIPLIAGKFLHLANHSS